MDWELDNLLMNFMDKLYDKDYVVTPDSLQKAINWLRKAQKTKYSNIHTANQPRTEDLNKAIWNLIKEFMFAEEYLNAQKEYYSYMLCMASL